LWVEKGVNREKKTTRGRINERLKGSTKFGGVDGEPFAKKSFQ